MIEKAHIWANKNNFGIGFSKNEIFWLHCMIIVYILPVFIDMIFYLMFYLLYLCNIE